MATIKTDSFQGGGGIGEKNAAGVELAAALRDVATDLAALNTAIQGLNITSADPTAITGADPTAITAADAGAALGAFTDPPSAAEMATLRTRVNEILTLGIDFKARFAEYRTLILDLKARQAENRTLLVEIKTDVSAGTGGTLLTIAG